MDDRCHTARASNPIAPIVRDGAALDRNPANRGGAAASA